MIQMTTNKALKVPTYAKILSKLSLVCNWGHPCYKNQDGMHAQLNPNILEPPNFTIAIVDNIFYNNISMHGLCAHNGILSARFDISNHINIPTITNKKLLVDSRGDALYEIIMSGCVGAGGILRSDTELCAMTYGPHCNLILKNGKIYKKLKP